MLLSESDHILNKFKMVLVGPQIIPVQPGDLAVLTVSVVIAVLRVGELITGQDHRRPAAAHEYCHRVAHHLLPERLNDRIICMSFHAAVPASVVIGAVCIVPSIGLIVLVIVGKQVIQREAVVAGDKIDGGIAALVRRLAVHICGSGDPRGCLRRVPVTAF